ncbi:hypothetical protein ABFS83_01G042200 [Erythranthe nasuta]
MTNSNRLEELNLNYKELVSTIKTLDKRIDNSKATAIELANAYFLLQATLCTAELSFPWAGGALTRNRSISVSVSALASIVFWVFFVRAVNECVVNWKKQENTFMEKQRVYRVIYSIRTGMGERDDGGPAANNSLTNHFAFVRFKRYTCIVAICGVLLSCTLLVTYRLLFAPPAPAPPPPRQS